MLSAVQNLQKQWRRKRKRATSTGQSLPSKRSDMMVSFKAKTSCWSLPPTTCRRISERSRKWRICWNPSSSERNNQVSDVTRIYTIATDLCVALGTRTRLQNSSWCRTRICILEQNLFVRRCGLLTSDHSLHLAFRLEKFFSMSMGFIWQ